MCALPHRASKEGTPDLGNTLMTLSWFPCEQYRFLGGQQKIIALLREMVKSEVDSRNSVSNSPGVPELKVDFSGHRVYVDHGMKHSRSPITLTALTGLKTVQKKQQETLVDILWQLYFSFLDQGPIRYNMHLYGMTFHIHVCFCHIGIHQQTVLIKYGATWN